MPSWLWALILKPFIGIAILAGMYYLPRFLAIPIWWLLPDGRLRAALFDGWEWGGRVGRSLPKRRQICAPDR